MSLETEPNPDTLCSQTKETALQSSSSLVTNGHIMNRRLLLTCFCWCFVGAGFAAEKPNVLFIAVDDLRPQLNCYGREQMLTPNIDALAGRGVLFERAYCMVPTCGASRASLMTSIRPSRNRFVTHLAWAEKEAAQALPLHTHFKHNGYATISLGKVFHHKADHASGWSEPAWRSSKPGYQDQAAQRAAIAQNKKQWPQKAKHNAAPFEAYDAEDSQYPDGDCANRAIDYLQRFAQSPDQPFFLAVGFMKPHLPFNAPQKYWDLYDADSIHMPDNYYPPTDAPAGAVHNSGELRAYAGIHPKQAVDEATALKLIHGYYACVSFTDSQIGRLLQALDELGLRQNTIIVLWGDHGWQLGEHGMWNKHSCFETSMHAPLIVVAPNHDAIAAGTRVSGLTEFIDIYPSLCELAGLDIPQHVQGSSFVPQMINPSLPGKPFAVGRFGAGDTIRADNLRYSEYANSKGEITGNMLYDHLSDPDENTNIAVRKPSETRELSKQLEAIKGR
jgi:iduronate 2-sulfatase